MIQLDVVQLLERLEESRLSVAEHMLGHYLDDVIELAREARVQWRRLVKGDGCGESLAPRCG